MNHAPMHFASLRLDRQRALAAAAGAALIAVDGRPALAAPATPADRRRFKFSLAAYSYRGLLQDPSAEFTLSDFIADCARFGLEGAELTSYYFPAEVTRAYLVQLKGECFRAGLDVSGTAIRNDFGQAPGMNSGSNPSRT